MGNTESHTAALLDYMENGKKDDIIKLSMELKGQFIDDEFDVYEQNDLYADSEVKWLRPYEFGQDYLFTRDNTDVSAENIVGYVSEVKGFITAASSLCSRIDYLKSIFLVYNVNAGCACLELCLNSEKKLVIIDDRIPCVIINEIIHPLYANYLNGGCWILLLLKAFAKLYGGYSCAFPCSTHSMVAGAKEFLRDLTGEHCISFLTKESLNTYIKYELPKDYTATKQFEKALNWAYYSQGKCFNAFLTHLQFKMAVISCSSLIKKEAIEIQDYSIVYVDQNNHRGDIPDITTDIDLEISVRNCPTDATPGTNNVYNWKDFVFNFDYVNAALLGHFKNWNIFSSISGEWRDESAGGAIFRATWRDNPMFRVTIPKSRTLNGKLLITLSLPDGRVNKIESYPRIAVTVCLDDPTLNDIIAHTAYEPRRDSTIEIDLFEDVWVYDIIPSTYEAGIESEFFITATLSYDGYERSPVQIERIINWKGFENTETFYGNWDEGISAYGRLGSLRENTFCNPCWKMSIPFPRNIDTIDFKICIILATEKRKKENKIPGNKEYSLSLFDDNEYLYTGTYLLTPNSLKLMKQQNPDFEKGIMGRFGFARSPFTNRKEMFQVSLDSRSERIDRTKGAVFKDLIIMPTTFREEEEGSFKITVMTNVPTIISRLAQEEPYNTEGLNQKYQKKKVKTIDINKSAFMNQICLRGSGTRSILLETVQSSYERPRDPKLIQLEKSQRIKIWEDDEDVEEEDILARHPLKQFKPKTSDLYKEKFEQEWKEYWNRK